MTYSYTGIIYIFLSAVLAFGASKFYRVWQKQKIFVSKIFAYLLGFTGFSMFFDGLVGGIIFAEKQKIGDLTATIGFFLTAVMSGIMGYLAVYLKFPKIPPRYGFFIMFGLGLGVAILNLFYPTHTFLEPTKFINWQSHPLVGMLRSLTVLLPCIPITIAFLQQAKTATDERTKKRSLGLGIFFLLGTINFTIDFFASGFTKSNAMTADLGIAATGIVLLLIFLLVPTVGSVPYVKKVE